MSDNPLDTVNAVMEFFKDPRGEVKLVSSKGLEVDVIIMKTRDVTAVRDDRDRSVLKCIEFTVETTSAPRFTQIKRKSNPSCSSPTPRSKTTPH